MGRSRDEVSSCMADVRFSYVGNKMATFVMQSLGCDVSAINTVHYSKHPSACPKRLEIPK